MRFCLHNVSALRACSDKAIQSFDISQPTYKPSDLQTLLLNHHPLPYNPSPFTQTPIDCPPCHPRHPKPTLHPIPKTPLHQHKTQRQPPHWKRMTSLRISPLRVCFPFPFVLLYFETGEGRMAGWLGIVHDSRAKC